MRRFSEKSKYLNSFSLLDDVDEDEDIDVGVVERFGLISDRYVGLLICSQWRCSIPLPSWLW